MKKNKKKKIKVSYVIGFVVGLIIYLIGLFLLFGASLIKLDSVKKYIPDIFLTRNTITNVKIFGVVLFIIGFIIFMFSIINLYKTEKIKENVKDLIVEGRADVITIIVMTYVLIIMLIICLLFEEVIGALLFGLAILIQSVLNNCLLKYFKKRVD